MSKSILMSNRSKWCAKIMNEDKKLEVRKGTALYKAIQKLIEEYGFADIYMYCTKEETLEYIYDYNDNFGEYISHKGKCWGDEPLNGKVAFKFRCYKVEEIMIAKTLGVPIRFTKELPERKLCVKSCLTPYDFKDYLQDKIGTAIHISDLEIFDEPKELSEFYKEIGKYHCYRSGCPYFDTPLCRYASKCEFKTKLTKAPQSWCYVEIGE